MCIRDRPYALALRKEIIFYQTLEKVHHKFDTPLYVAAAAFLLTLLWMLLHWLSVDGTARFHFTLFQGLEVDNLPIVLTYVFNGLLYLAVIVKGIDGRCLNWRQRYLYPVLALAGALLVMYGGIIQPKFNVYLIICLLGIAAGLFLRPTISK